MARQWQMMRYHAGDYVCPSNDKETLYRFSTYDDEGRTRWAVRSIERDVALYLIDVVSDLDEMPWRDVSIGYASRKAALDAVFGGTNDDER